MTVETRILVRKLRVEDLDSVVRIDAAIGGRLEPRYWQRVFRDFVQPDDGRLRVGLAADAGTRTVGFLFGEVRAFEFGSKPSGWIFAVGVEPGRRRERIASQLLQRTLQEFRDARIATVRTMVEKSDVPVLSFFRANGFIGGRFVQLELNLVGAP